MTVDPLVLVNEVERATARLITTVRTLDGSGLSAPSLCAGWTRGHVLSHIARNADGAVNLLTWARTGIETPQYVSLEQRDADIEAGAGRPLDEQLDDIEQSAARFVEAVDLMPLEAWPATVRWTSGQSAPALMVVWSRLREVEVHHVDLDAGYGPADWPEAFTLRLLQEVAHSLPGLAVRLVADDLPLTVEVGSEPVTVSGPARLLAGWLTGRTDGAGLAVEPEGPLPTVPSWK